MKVPLIKDHAGLYTDYYELAMAQAYYLQGKADDKAVFDYFFRKNPFNGGYVLFSGINELLEMLEELHFSQQDLDYLKQIGFDDDFLDYLSRFSFTATIKAPREGEVVFPIEPVLTVKGKIIELQIIETMLLNLLNFSSLVSTKASRIRSAAGNRLFTDFGLRRAQGTGGITASRAAIVGGANSTSNVISGFYYGLPVSGTMAHSWIQTFDDELTAFRKFAECYPENTVLLLDTYNTISSGIPNAIKVAKEMEERGERMKGIRLDSGDLAYLSKQARKMLDNAGLDYVKIMVSNQLDEAVIRSLNLQKAPIDGFGIGTKLITGMESAAIDGVYKLSEFNGQPRMKISDNIEKTTLPGEKRTVRYLNKDGTFHGDGILLESETQTKEIIHPYFNYKRTNVESLKHENITRKVMENGKRLSEGKTAKESAEYARERLAKLPEEHHRQEYPHHFKVGISQKLAKMRDNMFENINKKEEL